MTIPIIEVYGPVLQGEGILQGYPSIFVRTGGCDFRCSWCDSMFAVDPHKVSLAARQMTHEEILGAVEKLNGRGAWVTLTGGNPLLWDLTELVKALAVLGYHAAVETQGSIWKDWVDLCDEVIVSPKGPSASTHNEGDLYKFLGDCFRVSLKVVVKDQGDYSYARDLHRRYPRTRMFLQPCTDLSTKEVTLTGPLGDKVKVQEKKRISAIRSDILKDTIRLAEMVCADPEMRDVCVLPQLHVLMYGAQRRR